MNLGRILQGHVDTQEAKTSERKHNDIRKQELGIQRTHAQSREHIFNQFTCTVAKGVLLFIVLKHRISVDQIILDSICKFYPKQLN